jgi:hypothetical protein
MATAKNMGHGHDHPVVALGDAGHELAADARHAEDEFESEGIDRAPMLGDSAVDDSHDVKIRGLFLAVKAGSIDDASEEPLDFR